RHVGEQRNVYAPFGASCLSLADSEAEPVIHGGPMVGLRCRRDAVVSPSTNAVLAIEASEAAPPTPCIRCGWCTDHCPARLNVAALNDAFELAILDRARRAGALACVECGVCTYVCPARLPLSQRLKQLKRAIRRQTASAPQGRSRKTESHS
ncbi:MAG: 4Fe-4S dicluster domain-containing protein, partial [Phycisphaerae bacterium]|nr:4Fe-4S dicluster domain-containing protein [Phycisphaerae bacterium]